MVNRRERIRASVHSVVESKRPEELTGGAVRLRRHPGRGTSAPVWGGVEKSAMRASRGHKGLPAGSRRDPFFGSRTVSSGGDSRLCGPTSRPGCHYREGGVRPASRDDSEVSNDLDRRASWMAFCIPTPQRDVGLAVATTCKAMAREDRRRFWGIYVPFRGVRAPARRAPSLWRSTLLRASRVSHPTPTRPLPGRDPPPRHADQLAARVRLHPS